MRLIASLVCAIESTRSLRCVVRNVWRVSSSSNCSIAIMLTGPSRSILARSAAIASSARQRPLRRLVAATGSRRRLRRRRAVGRRRPRRRRPARRRRSTPRIRRRLRRRAPAASTSASTSSSVACTASTHDAARGARGRFRRSRARRRARRPRRGSPRARARASLIDAVLLRRPARAARPPRRRPLARRRAARRARGRRRRAAPRPATIAARSSSTRRRVCVELGGERRGARSSSARGLLEPLHLGGERRRALDQRGVRGAGLGGAAAQVLGRLARLEQAPLRVGQPLVGRALLVLEPGDRRARLVLAAIERVALLFGLTALARELLAPSARAASLRRRRAAAAPRSRRWPSPAGDARRSARRSRSSACAIVAFEPGGLLGEREPARRARPRCARAAP